MDTTELVSRILPHLKKHWLPVGLGALGTIFFAYGLIGLFLSGNSASEDIVFEASEKKLIEKSIFVDIEGAVVKPGLYKLPYDSRIQDSLIAAGGLSALADREYIAKNINLATKLTDGGKIYIPEKGETESIKDIISIKGSTQVLTGQININNASESELDTLPGVGPATASKIIGGRPYTSIDELLSKKVVGNKVFEQIKEKVSIY